MKTLFIARDMDTFETRVTKDWTIYKCLQIKLTGDGLINNNLKKNQYEQTSRKFMIE